MKENIVGLDISNLWAAYMNNSMATCINQYALQTITDLQIRSLYEKTLKSSEYNVRSIVEFFNNEQHPIPHGFTKEDVNLKAPRLFTDEYLLFYLHEMSILGLNAYSLGSATAIRDDVYQFYTTAYQGASELYRSSMKMMQSKGLLERSPVINLPEQVEFSEKQSFLAGWFGDHRPLNVIEITSLYFNLKKSIMTKALILGFSQTAQSKKIRDFMLKLVELGDKHINLFAAVLNEDFINSAITWDTHVTDSRTAPFSDKLMMAHGGFLIQTAMAYYGTAFSSAMRRDLGAKYAAAIVEDAKVAEDGMNIMIANGWFEQPPHTVDRKELSKM
ncbi:DUF3231 family protein [Schinkia sp. CFF1]